MIRRRRPTPVRRPRRAPAIRRHAGNPYFNKHRRSSTSDSGWKQYLLLIGLPAAILLLIGYLVWGPTLKVKQIAVNGATESTERALRQIVNAQLSRPGFLPPDNVLLFDEERLADTIGKSYFLEDLKIEKRLPGHLDISVVEKSVRLALLADQRFLGLDAEGYLVRELTEAEASMLGPLPPDFGQALAPELGAEEAVIEDEAAAEAGLADEDNGPTGYPIITLSNDPADRSDLQAGGQPIQASAASFIIQAASQLSDYTDEPAVRYVSRGRDSDTVEAVMRVGWEAYFSASQPFDRQANKLSLILRDKVGSRRQDLEYVDLRYGERIFFKFKSPEPTEE